MKSNRLSKFFAVPALSCVVLVISPARAYSQVPAAEPARTISELAWMAGDWQTAAGGRAQIEEHWTQPAGGTMIGMGRTIAGGRTAEFEYLRLEQRADAIYYVAHPKARSPGTDFKLTRLTAQEAVFENPQHDFPKRIIYRKNSDGSLTASIDAGEGTKSQSFAYLPMKK
ncbi:MAG TPA: DUF6265 family protein [Pirellulaceae bacterium]|nr:DUF6265 family protein [Pirellulaceae bacterium]